MPNLMEFQDRVDELNDKLVQSIIDIFYENQGRALSSSSLQKALIEREEVMGGHAAVAILLAEVRGVVTIDQKQRLAVTRESMVHLAEPFRINLLSEEGQK
jgi:hypothetical protein